MGRLLGLVVLAACAHQAPQPAPIVVSPYRELLVPAVIDGRQLTLMIDTGASTTTLTPRACNRLLLNYYGLPGRGDGITGPIDDITLVKVGFLQIADHVVHQPYAAVVEMAAASRSIDGVLGMDVLGDYTTEVDLSRRQLILHPRSSTAWLTPDLIAFSYHRLRGGQLWIDASIDGRPVAAIIDLGANLSFANVRATPDREEAALVVRAVVGADRHIAQFAAMRDVPIVVGPLDLMARVLLIADLPIFDVVGLSDRPAMILGADLLRDRRLVIAPDEQRLYVSLRGSP
jgi:predicted aspartyl protease